MMYRSNTMQCIRFSVTLSMSLVQSAYTVLTVTAESLATGYSATRFSLGRWTGAVSPLQPSTETLSMRSRWSELVTYSGMSLWAYSQQAMPCNKSVRKCFTWTEECPAQRLPREFPTSMQPTCASFATNGSTMRSPASLTGAQFRIQVQSAPTSTSRSTQWPQSVIPITVCSHDHIHRIKLSLSHHYQLIKFAI